MKLLKCEVCGSNDLTKKDGLFVCDYCGAKYSLEEVQRMAGNVSISGSVELDSSSRLRGFVQAAYDAYENMNMDDMRGYAEQALGIDPTNADALWAMTGYCREREERRLDEYCGRAAKHSANSLGIIT